MDAIPSSTRFRYKDYVTADTAALFRRGLKKEAPPVQEEDEAGDLEGENIEDSSDDEGGLKLDDLWAAIDRPRSLLKKDLSEATWHWADNMGEVTHPKANLWTHTGVMRDSKLMCFVEEALYAVERGTLLLHLGLDRPATVQEVYALLDHPPGPDPPSALPAGTESSQNQVSSSDGPPPSCDSPGGRCSWEEFAVYSHLRRLGYIVGRHGVVWSESRQAVLPATDMLTAGEAGKAEERGREEKTEGTDGWERGSGGGGRGPWQLVYDVYLPNKHFKKSDPDTPLFSLCIASERPPGRREIAMLEAAAIPGIPVKVAAVGPGLVSIFGFQSVTVPPIPA